MTRPKQSEAARGEGEREAGAGEQGPPRPVCLAVAGIGASAGGLDAFKRFLQAIPADTHLAFVLVPHLDPSHESLMVELLARHTPMPVCEAQDGMAVAPDRVYVIPPNRYLAIEDGLLRLWAPPETHGGRTAIDFLLRSLADDCQERAIGIILSGTGSHGTRGLQAIKARGGLTLVQEPATAEYDQMPRSAITAGVADYVLAPEAMGDTLVRYLSHASRNGTWQGPPPNDDPLGELGKILALLHSRTGYDFRGHRKQRLLHRVRRRMSVCQVDRLADYLERLRADAEEPGRLFRDLLRGVTGFFHDPKAYAALEQEVIAPLAAQAAPGVPVRVWVPGCATGEEAYSIAILVIEAFARRGSPCQLQVYATDIDEEALRIGRRGLYPQSIAGDMGPERLERFFLTPDEHHYQVSRPLREAVTFGRQDILSDAPFSRLDLISCRNLLMYLEPEVQQKVVALFHFALKEGGHLFLGPSESVGQGTEPFATVSRTGRLFRRKSRTEPQGLVFPITPGPTHRSYPAPMLERRTERAKGLAAFARRLSLDTKDRASALVNSGCEILYYFGRTADFLALPTEEPRRDLMAMAREGLRTKLRAACRQALMEQRPITLDDAKVKRGGHFAPVQVRVEPLMPSPTAEPLLLVSFEDRKPEEEARAGAAPVREAADVSSPPPDLELKAAREELAETIEELETANAELMATSEETMAMNEELQSSNEELETAKEELQSLNEALATANTQLRNKVEELERLNDDITNLLVSTDIATVFLDRSMRIQRFTPSAAPLYNLRESDLGRRVGDLNGEVSDEGLLADAETVLEDLIPREREVTTSDGRYLLRRVRPYLTRDKRIEGVVATFVDITSREQAERRLRKLNRGLEQRTAELARREAELRALAANVPAMFSYVDAGEVYRYANRLYEQHHGLSADQIVGKSVRELLGAENYTRAKPHIAKALAGETERYESTFAFTDGVHTMEVVLVPELDAQGCTQGFYTLVHDITKRKALEQRLHEREERLRAIVETAGDAIITIDHEGLIQDYNPAAERMFGRPAAAVIGQAASLLLPPSCRDCPDYPTCFRMGQCLHATHRPQELMGRRRDGTLFPMEMTVGEIDDLGLYVALARDISGRRALERQIIEVSTAEQERIGRDIHDGIGQQLTALTMLAGSIERRLTAAQRPAEAQDVKELMGHLQDTLDQARALARGLSPVEIDPEGLLAALSALTEGVRRRSGVDCCFVAGPGVKVRDEILAVHLYRIAQEALHNALRHGQPRKIRVRLVRDAEDLILSVYDDGSGIQPVEERRSGLGLHVMRYRAGILRGQLTIETPKEGGTLVTCRCPAGP